MRWYFLALMVLAAGCATSTPEPPTMATVEVPIQFIENIALVGATVNGTSGTAVMIVDTGAAATILTPRLLARLGLDVPADAPKRKIRVVGGRTLDVPFLKIAKVQVGRATMNDQEVGVYDIYPDAPIIDGLLGGDFLHRFRVTLDRNAKQMRLEPLRR
jgi:predicted aspartyl protease